MANQFPTGLNNFVTGSSSGTLASVGHAAAHNALEAKLGVDSSAVTTTIDYLLKNSASTNPGHKHTTSAITNLPTMPASTVVGTTDTQTLTNKTLTAPIIATISNTGTLTLPTITDTLVARTTTDTLTNKTLTSPTINTATINTATINTATLPSPTVTGTLSIQNNITQSGSADHIVITPGASKLVKIATLQQDNTTNNYKNNQVILTGNGKINGNNTGVITGTVTFGITFSAAPMVFGNFVGYQGAGAYSYPVNATQDNIFATVGAVSTTQLTVELTRTSGTFSNATDFYYTWLAIGTL